MKLETFKGKSAGKIIALSPKIEPHKFSEAYEIILEWIYSCGHEIVKKSGKKVK